MLRGSIERMCDERVLKGCREGVEVEGVAVEGALRSSIDMEY